MHSVGISPRVLSFLLPLLLGATIAPTEKSDDGCTPANSGQVIVSLKFEGLDYTATEVVERELLQRVDHQFSCTLWQQEYRRLHNLDIFAAINIETHSNEEGLDLIYRFRELPIVVPYPSVKRTDQDGWLLGAGATTVNFMGQALHVDIAARTSIDPAFGTKEVILFSHSRWLFDLPVGHEMWFQFIQTYNVLKEFDEQAAFGTLELYPHLFERVEAIIAGGVLRTAHTNSAPVAFQGSGSADIVPRLAVGVRRDGRDDRGDPRSGTYAELRMTQHGGALGGPADFQEYLADLRGAASINSRNVVLASGLLRQRIGNVPFYEALHVGGPNTLRAYQPKASRRGDSELLGSTEYRYVLAERTPFSVLGIDAYAGVQAVMGADVALLWGTRPFEDVRGFGAAFVGLHVILPGVQRLRLELGVQDDGRTFGFTAGVYERATIQRWRAR
jgi:outer membrane protein assembly factor BamA